MKQLTQKVLSTLNQMHDYPYIVLLVFLYLAIITFLACGIVVWFPSVLQRPEMRDTVGEQLFELGTMFTAIGGITAPIMDLILHHDVGHNK